MAQIVMRGHTLNTNGELPEVGTTAPDFALTNRKLEDLTSESLRGSRVVLNIFPSIDTPTCATSVRTFNQRAGEFDNTKVLCVSADLPFAQTRFCGAEGIKDVEVASTFRHPEFLADYGVGITDGGMAGLCARAVVVINSDGSVLHTELVREIANEPNYDAALAVLV